MKFYLLNDGDREQTDLLQLEDLYRGSTPLQPRSSAVVPRQEHRVAR